MTYSELLNKHETQFGLHGPLGVKLAREKETPQIQARQHTQHTYAYK